MADATIAARPIAMLAVAKDDEARAVAAALSSLGFDAVRVGDGAALLDALADFVSIDMIVASVALRRLDGVFIVEELRALGFTQPIILLDHRDDVVVKVRAARLAACALVRHEAELLDLATALCWLGR